MRRYGSIFVKDVWSQDIKLASRYLYFCETGWVSAKLLAHLLPVSTLSLSANIGTKDGPLKYTNLLGSQGFIWILMPNLQLEEIVAVLVIGNFVRNSSMRELQKHNVNGSERVKMVTSVHLRLFKCIYMMPTFLYFSQSWIFPPTHRFNCVGRCWDWI
jgi:hypothetical protein